MHELLVRNPNQSQAIFFAKGWEVRPCSGNEFVQNLLIYFYGFT